MLFLSSQQVPKNLPNPSSPHVPTDSQFSPGLCRLHFLVNPVLKNPMPSAVAVPNPLSSPILNVPTHSSSVSIFFFSSIKSKPRIYTIFQEYTISNEISVG